jgi:hypothetical protein
MVGRDLDQLIERLYHKRKLKEAKNKLIKRKIYAPHAAMQLVCSDYLISKGYRVGVEEFIEKTLCCDILAKAGKRKLIVEIEYRPRHAGSRKIRECSKIARYSPFSDEFVLGVPAHYSLQLPELLVKDPNLRDVKELEELKVELDKQYRNPKIELSALLRCHIDSIYLIDVDKVEVVERKPTDYVGS